MDRLTDLLDYISPDEYETWTIVGMALKHEGYSISDWEAWSTRSAKYKVGECQKKWGSFNETNTGQIVTGGTIYQLAKDGGYTPPSQAFGWDDEVDEIGRDYKIIDSGFVKEQTVPKMQGKPIDDTREYLNLLFEKDDYVGYCDKLDLIEDKWIPVHGLKSRTAGQLLDDLKHGFENSTIKGESAGGAMIRFNPLDGTGESDANVTDFRFCMVESDKDSLEKQYALYKEMKLPIVCLVHSGNKSLHAIIHVDAGQDHRLYRQRVNFIYEFCKKNGLQVDQNDKNASRYSRLPGIKRGDNYQYIVARNIGFSNYEEWKNWADTQNDNLPDDVSLASALENLPSLKPEVIEGILREGHKLLISGPSKAGKSFALMNLVISIAEGLPWLGRQCRKGRVLYINLELDEASCFHRFHDIYNKLRIEPKHADDITIWNLRGRAVPMDKLAPFLINRYKGKGYTAVVLDPIYKVITGDENSATEMSMFCSYFDRAALEIGASMIYCHHHSKGAGMKYSRAADRASGSGVFARDPDAILDLIELEATPEMITRYKEQVPDSAENLSAWELSGTLREFPPMNNIRMWFDYPFHRLDEWNFLAEAKEGETAARGVGVGKKQKTKTDWKVELQNAYEMHGGTDKVAVSLNDIVGYLQINGKPSQGTIKKRLQQNGFSVSKVGSTEMVLQSVP